MIICILDENKEEVKNVDKGKDKSVGEAKNIRENEEIVGEMVSF